MKKLFILMIGLFVSLQAFAEPRSMPVKVVQLRPYQGSNAVFVTVDSNVFCGTDTFHIDMSQSLGKEAFAAALTALASDKFVMLEIHEWSYQNSVCLGVDGTTNNGSYGARLRSIILNK